jgi:hypothetical protein
LCKCSDCVYLTVCTPAERLDGSRTFCECFIDSDGEEGHDDRWREMSYKKFIGGWNEPLDEETFLFNEEQY